MLYLIGQIFITVQRVQLTFNFILCYDIILCLEEMFDDLFSPCLVCFQNCFNGKTPIFCLSPFTLAYKLLSISDCPCSQASGSTLNVKIIESLLLMG